MTTPYHPLARGLHWLMALLIAGLLVLGHYMSELPLSPEKLQYFSWHKWTGVTVFALLWVRLAWRLVHRPPALSDTLSPLQQRLAHTGHGALYLLMLAMPLSGWLMSSAKGFNTTFFGLFDLPNLIERDKALAASLKSVHGTLANLLMVLVVAHIGAALKHQLIDKDNLMARMRPARQK